MRDPQDGNQDRDDIPERAHAEAGDVVAHAANERVHEVGEADDIREPHERDREAPATAQRDQRDHGEQAGDQVAIRDLLREVARQCRTGDRRDQDRATDGPQRMYEGQSREDDEREECLDPEYREGVHAREPRRFVSAPEFALDGLARLRARSERERDLDGFGGRLRETDLVDPGLVEMLSLVRDVADAIGPAAGALEHDRRLVLVRDGQLVQRADPAADHDDRVGGADDERVAHPAHAGRDRDVDVRIRVAFVESGQDPDHQPASALRAAAYRLHHAGEAAGDHDRAALREQLPHLFAGPQRARGHGVSGIASAFADDRDDWLSCHVS